MKNESGSPLLLEAIKKGKFRTLMENSDAIDYTVTDIQDNTAAHVVTNIKDVELLYNNVKGHLDVSKYFNQWNKYKNTPLYNAAEIASDSGNKDILNFILDPKNGIKADINAKGKYDDTILHMCLLQRKNGIKKERNDQVIGILLEHGADPNINNKENITPVHYAAKFHNFEVLKMFLGGKIKANVNAQDNDSNTPLHYAIIPNSNNELERNNVVDLLIANGADLTLKNNKGQTPIEYLVEKRSKDAADNLIEYLEKRNQKNTF
jgi:ankyrin repeat protein